MTRAYSRRIGLLLAVAALAACDEGDAIWDDQSQTLAISWFSFFDGGYRFTRERAQLTDEQLELLGAIRTIEPESGCADDAPGVTVTVTDAAGEAHRYFGNTDDARCDGNDPFVSYDAVAALLDTVDCLSAKSYTHDSPADAPEIGVGDGCGHGLFNSEPVDAWWFRVEVEASGERRFAIQRCADREVRLSLLGEAGDLLGEQTADGEPCAVLTQEVEAAGTYGLHVEMLGGEQAGDFYLSVD